MIALDITKMILPVLIAIIIGWGCSRISLFGQNGLDTLKKVISKITLPLVLFNAFFTVDYSIRLLIIFVFMYLTCGVALSLGYFTKKLVRPYDTYMPFLLTCFEAGMLGYALYAVLVGPEYTSVFAMIDIGQTMFAYTVFLTLLQSAEGNKPTVKGLVLNMLKNPAADGMLLGIILGAAGLGRWILSSSVSGIYRELISFITAPTACIILIVVGYELSLKKDLLRPVFITVGTRLLINAALLAAISFLLFKIIPFDRRLMLGLMVMFSLPAPFVIPLFADVKKDGEYISTSLSMSTLLSVLLFVGISVYSVVSV